MSQYLQTPLHNTTCPHLVLDLPVAVTHVSHETDEVLLETEDWMSSLVSGHCVRVGQLRHIAEDVLSLLTNHPGTVQQIWNNHGSVVIHAHSLRSGSITRVCRHPRTLTEIWINHTGLSSSTHTHSDLDQSHGSVVIHAHSLRSGTITRVCRHPRTLTEIWNNHTGLSSSTHTH